ncbi:hypothetical protein SAFG77S_04044 [Streptomyces afghaniensis]
MLGLVRHEHAPRHSGEPGGVQAHRAVRGEHELPVGQAVEAAPRAVEAPHGCAGGEPLDLPLPVAHQGRRADHQGGPGGPGVGLPVQVQGDECDRLAEPHVVGEAAAEAQRGHPGEPVQAPPLVVPQGGGEGSRLLHGLLRLGVREPLPQGRQPSGGPHLDPAAVHLGPARQRRAQRVHRRHLVVLPGAGQADLLRVDQDPLVAQPHHGALGLGEPVQLFAAQPPVAQRERPVEGEQRVGGQERRHGREDLTGLRLVVGRPHLRACGELPGQPLRPVHVHSGRSQRPGARTEQLGDLLVGELDRVRHGRRQQGRERGPGPGRAAQGEQRVHPRARAEGLAPGAGPDVRGVRDERGIAHAVHLEHGPERHVRVVVRSVRQAVRLDPQRQPHPRVVARGDIGGPRALLGKTHRLGRRVGGSAGDQRCGGGAGQGVGDRVEEGAQQPLRVGEPQRPGARQWDGVRLGRHRGGKVPHGFDVLGAQGARPPGVVVARGQPRQQQSARHEVQGVRGRRAPEHGGPVPMSFGTRTCEDRQGRAHRQHNRGHTQRLYAVIAGHDDGQVSGGRRRHGRRGLAVGSPEGDAAGSGRVAGHEHGAEVGQFGELGGGCRGSRMLGYG